MQKFNHPFLQIYRTTKFNNNFIPTLICFLPRNVENPDILKIRQKICSDLIAMKKGGTDLEDYYWNKNIVGIIARYKMHIRRLKGFEYLKEDIEKMYHILLTLERERDYFLHKYKS